MIPMCDVPMCRNHHRMCDDSDVRFDEYFESIAELNVFCLATFTPVSAVSQISVETESSNSSKRTSESSMVHPRNGILGRGLFLEDSNGDSEFQNDSKTRNKPRSRIPSRIPMCVSTSSRIPFRRIFETQHSPA